MATAEDSCASEYGVEACDPMCLNFGDNPDEYESEAGTILPRLRTCASAQDMQRVVHEEFCRWFGAEQAGSIDLYEPIARVLWTEIGGARWSNEEP